MQSTVVPLDFPHNPFPASLSGYQPKVAARFIDGRYVVGLTDAELERRYICCANLVEQLSVYVQKKQTDFSGNPVAQLLPQISA